MKQLFLGVFIFVSLQSCIKTMDVAHDTHDTIYLSRLQIDTFTRTNTVTDTFVIHDNHADTVTQIKHDTLIIVKTRTDTLFKSFLDTVYLTRAIHDTTVQIVTVIKHDTLQGNTTVVVRHDTVINNVIVPVHDTVSKTVYLHDTLNNFVKVFIHDTVVKIDTVVTYDTVTNYVSVNYLNYPVPAPDSGKLLYIALDTVPGMVIHTIEFQNVFSWTPVAPIESHQGIFQQDKKYSLDQSNLNPYAGSTKQYQLYIPGPMVANIIITYDYGVDAPQAVPLFQFDTFNYGAGVQKVWQVYAPSGIASPPGTRYLNNTSTFSNIDLTQVFSLTIRNHY